MGPNSGVFSTYDESDNSNIITTGTAARGTSATIDYNETPTSIVVGFDFASIDIQPVDDEWSSGEEIPIVLVDGDANQNSRSDEDLDVNNPTVNLIPALQTGTPFTLAISGDDLSPPTTTTTTSINATYVATITESAVSAFEAYTAGVAENATQDVEAFSDRAIITPGAGLGASGTLLIDLDATFGDLLGTIGNTTTGAEDRLRGFNFFNYDVRSLSNTTTSVDIYLVRNGPDPNGRAIIDIDGDLNDTATILQIVDNGALQRVYERSNLEERCRHSTVQHPTRLPRPAFIGARNDE